ncbi:MAG: FAD-dependent oxidoreductase [Geminicoccaceae bacterium]
MTTDADIVVVGAGAAGLAAAAELAALGRSVILLEAAGQIGGRARTVEPVPGLPFDLGASFIHAADAGNPWADLALAVGARPQADPRHRLLAADGIAAAPAELLQLLAGLDDLKQRIAALATGGTAAVAEAVPPAHPQAGYLRSWAGAWICGEDAAAVDAADWAQSRAGQDWLLPDGYGRLVTRFGRHLPVRLGHAVERILVGGGRVRVLGRWGAVDAGAAIVTVPVGVLLDGRPVFEPGLPDAVRSALEGVRPGLLMKIGLQLADAGRELGDDVYLSGHGDAPASLLFHMRGFGRPMAMAFAGGALARELEAAGEAAAFAHARAALGEILGHAAVRAVAPLAVSQWGRDPLARGSYSVARPGCAPARAVLQRPIHERIWLAGEACDSDGWAATVAGAYLSGRRAARAASAARRTVAIPP